MFKNKKICINVKLSIMRNKFYKIKIFEKSLKNFNKLEIFHSKMKKFSCSLAEKLNIFKYKICTFLSSLKNIINIHKSIFKNRKICIIFGKRSTISSFKSLQICKNSSNFEIFLENLRKFSQLYQQKNWIFLYLILKNRNIYINF